MKSSIPIFTTLLLAVILSIGGCYKAGVWLVKEDKNIQADAIVILMGSMADRILQATDLYQEGRAGKIIIAEASMGPFRELKARGASIISNTTQVHNALVSLGIRPDSIIILPGDARSTLHEAMMVREYLQKKPDMDTLILVSSAAHTRRSSMIFNHALKDADEPVHVYCSPSKYTNFNAEKWWKDKKGIQTVLMEYLKLVNFWIFEKRKLEEVGSK